jgi:hypothetical protein
MTPDTAHPPSLYREVQHFRQPLLWVLLIGLAGFSLFMVVGIILPGGSPDLMEISDPIYAAAVVAFGLGFPVFFAILALEVEVGPEGIRYRFFPIHTAYRTIVWSELARYRVASWRSTREYGGWGIRYKWKGYACTVCGDQGIIFDRKDGTRVMLGSAAPRDFVLAVEKWSGIPPAG